LQSKSRLSENKKLKGCGKPSNTEYVEKIEKCPEDEPEGINHGET